MKEHPILFSAAMVRAIIDGRKTQTRRVVRRSVCDCGEWVSPAEMCATTNEGYQTAGHSGRWWCGCCNNFDRAVTCPYGQPGDVLWVRETWRPWAHPDMWDGVMYRADGAFVKPEWLPEAQGHWLSNECENLDRRWRPSIHMPRWACRLFLRVTDVRVERVQDITQDAIVAEGAWNPSHSVDEDCSQAVEAWADLWDSVNGRRTPWDANPWVWVVSFECIQGEGGTR